ncbi:MAG: PepSY-like domain-containing protein, partial [Treponemataceae bacterium]|nr:PepSY-like domain-containing protein [Treponemataceae bacterium]
MRAMKTMPVVAVLFVLVARAAFADTAIPADRLPQQIRDAVAAAFPESRIRRAQADAHEYEVMLDDGTEIEFYQDGIWKEIDSRAEIPGSLLPEFVTVYVREHFPDAAVCKAEKNRRHLAVEISDGT